MASEKILKLKSRNVHKLHSHTLMAHVWKFLSCFATTLKWHDILDKPYYICVYVPFKKTVVNPFFIFSHPSIVFVFISWSAQSSLGGLQFGMIFLSGHILPFFNEKTIFDEQRHTHFIALHHQEEVQCIEHLSENQTTHTIIIAKNTHDIMYYSPH